MRGHGTHRREHASRTAEVVCAALVVAGIMLVMAGVGTIDAAPDRVVLPGGGLALAIAGLAVILAAVAVDALWGYGSTMGPGTGVGTGSDAGSGRPEHQAPADEGDGRDGGDMGFHDRTGLDDGMTDLVRAVMDDDERNNDDR